ncbi:hypothetical protein PN450_19300 [Dolichospermum lemmermannii CS-548]|uniref:hypothetical protein n=1 Tax=Dolichospermum TaxID=748770 RepID=UPI00143D0198|nr:MULTISPECIES: hypothetical protein [Dolichospermum]MDB9438894.1 hypothetical protein [Dolichospermum lemmermannii CS-548]
MPALQKFHDSTLYLIRAETAVFLFLPFFLMYFFVDEDMKLSRNLWEHLWENPVEEV